MIEIAIKQDTMSLYNHTAACDKNLSWGAKGIMSFLYFQARRMATVKKLEQFTPNENIQPYIDELERAGYIEIFNEQKLKFSA